MVLKMVLARELLCVHVQYCTTLIYCNKIYITELICIKNTILGANKD